jgi:hypothetical protein
MIGMSGPILKFLTTMYPNDPAERPQERKIAEAVKQVDIAKVATSPRTQFKVVLPVVTGPQTVRISFEAPTEDVERIRRHLRRPSMAAYKVGKHAFDHFLKTECPK